MPFTLLSHQAPVLPLKLLRPTAFCGTALLIGSMAPDLEYVALARLDPVHGHTWAGQLYFCLPLTLALVFAVRAVSPTLGRNLPDIPPFHLRDVHLLGRARPGPLDLVRVVTSSLIGSVSHVVLDAFTHRDGWGVHRFPVLATNLFEVWGMPVRPYRAMQLGGSLLLAIACMAMTIHVGRKRLLCLWYSDHNHMAPAPLHRRLYWAVAAPIGLTGAALSLANALPIRSVSDISFVGYATLQAGCWLFAGLVAAALAVAARARLTRLSPAEGSPSD